MLTLCNGHGQLGTELKKRLKPFKEVDLSIYHKWNIDDKSEKVQKKCYEEFKKYVKKSKKKILFISTMSKKVNAYTKYKKLAEAFAIENGHCFIKLPTMIGKGTCEGFKTGKLKPFGEMELISVEMAALFVLEFVCEIYLFDLESYWGEVPGEKVSANFVDSLIKYGSKK